MDSMFNKEDVNGHRDAYEEILLKHLDMRDSDHSIFNPCQNFANILIECLGNVRQACRKTGVPRSQYIEWMKTMPGFAESCAEASEAADDYVEGALIHQISKGDTRAIMFYCATKLRHRGYTTAVNVKHTYEANHDVTLDNMSDDDREILDRYVESKIKDLKGEYIKVVEPTNG